MAANDYHFVTHWRIPATPREIADVLEDAEDLPRWWPSVYLNATVLERGDERGVGRLVDLYTKGWLPYTLRWRLRVTDVDRPRGFALVADGDFVGRGVWTFVPDGAFTDVIYDWKISAEKPLLRRFSWFMKPLFAANHRWAMTRGEQSLNLELVRRMRSAQERALLPAPPGLSTAPSTAALIGVGVIAVALLVFAVRRVRTR